LGLFSKKKKDRSLMGIAITYAIANLAVLGFFFYATYRMTRKS